MTLIHGCLLYRNSRWMAVLCRSDVCPLGGRQVSSHRWEERFPDDTLVAFHFLHVTGPALDTCTPNKYRKELRHALHAVKLCLKTELGSSPTFDSVTRLASTCDGLLSVHHGGAPSCKKRTQTACKCHHAANVRNVTIMVPFHTPCCMFLDNEHLLAA